MIKPLAKRPDGSFVVQLENGWPYHVCPGDDLWELSSYLDWSEAPGELLPPEVVPLEAPKLISEKRLVEILVRLGYTSVEVERALQATEDS